MNGGPEEGTWLSKVRDNGNRPVAVVHQIESEEVRLSMNQRAKGLCSPRVLKAIKQIFANDRKERLPFVLVPHGSLIDVSKNGLKKRIFP